MTQITYSELRNSHITLYEQFLSLADIFRLQPTIQSCLNLFQYSITNRKSSEATKTKLNCLNDHLYDIGVYILFRNFNEYSSHEINSFFILFYLNI